MEIIRYLGGAYAERHKLEDGTGVLIIKKDKYGNEEYRYTQLYEDMGIVKEDYFDTITRREREKLGKIQIERI